MRTLLVFVVSLALLTSCSSKPPFTDNGNPGQIKAVVFYDDNKNGALDSNESSALVEVGISQDVSCPPTSMDKITFAQSDAGGAALFKELKPGKYCVIPKGNFNMTTKLTQEIYVSSDAVTTVMFGITKQ